MSNKPFLFDHRLCDIPNAEYRKGIGGFANMFTTLQTYLDWIIPFSLLADCMATLPTL